MKKIIILLFMFCGITFAQSIFTEPNYRDYESIYADTIITSDTTNAFNVQYSYGTITNAIKIVEVINSDSCLRVDVQYKNVGGGWGAYYTSTTTKSLLDTINRTLANTASAYIYFEPAEQTSWAHADSVRFIYTIGDSDSLKIESEVGGQ
jgi:hypothetical protein